MKTSKFTKFVAALGLAAASSSTWSAVAHAGSCSSSLKDWGTTYNQYCYNQWGYIVGSGTGKGETQPFEPNIRIAWVKLNTGTKASIFTWDRFGYIISSCMALDTTANSVWAYDSVGCQSAEKFKVFVEYP